MSLITGCYLNQHRHSAIALRIKDGKVTYLTMNTTKPTRYEGALVYEVQQQRVSLCTLSEHDFAIQFEVFLHNYPVLKAIKIYWRSGLDVTTEAEAAIRMFLVANKTRKVAA